MFGIGGFEFFIIIVFAFLIIGPDKFPELAKSAGKFVRKFRSAKDEMDKVIKAEVYDPNADDPFQAPIEALQKAGTTVENVKSGETFAQRKARYEAQRAAEREAAAVGAGVTAAAGAAAVSPAVSPEALYAQQPVVAVSEPAPADGADEPAPANDPAVAAAPAPEEAM